MASEIVGEFLRIQWKAYYINIKYFSSKGNDGEKFRNKHLGNRSEVRYKINSTRWIIFLDRSQNVNHNNIILPRYTVLKTIGYLFVVR